MMFPSYAHHCQNQSASAAAAEASFVCAQAANVCESVDITRMLDTVLVSIFVVLIAVIGLISIIILRSICLISLFLLAVLLMMDQLNSNRSSSPVRGP